MVPMNPHAVPKFCVLLTAVIDPAGMSYTRRTDPKTREADYIAVIEHVARHTSVGLVFYENSGYDLSLIKKTLESCAPGRYEAISGKGNTGFPHSLGKGYGELLIIRDALEKSTLLRQADYVIKETGRYRVLNIAEVLAGLARAGDFFVAAEDLSGERYAYSAFFVCKPEFIRSYLLPLLPLIDDSRKQPLETVLRQALDAAERDGRRRVSFPIKPLVSGVSGTWNVRLDPNRYNTLVFSWPKLKWMLRNYRASAKRRLFRLFHISSTIERS
jgi:hypothetical protein